MFITQSFLLHVLMLLACLVKAKQPKEDYVFFIFSVDCDRAWTLQLPPLSSMRGEKSSQVYQNLRVSKYRKIYLRLGITLL